ncbi:type II secretion system protein N [Lacisediminimonas sp.]|uniref:type II secretion system protein N n=1 Tax=Lacisediminimonas sp. TaxID=3060582 RepID=UPI00272AD915|nr:type II secretion system protein N [Lacisediminimonas sp.]
MATIAMKRWPYLTSFVLFVAVCASLAYWGMQLFKPPLRAVAAPPATQASAPGIDAAAALFGGRGGALANAGNYQLKGLVLASSLKDSVVILSANGKPAQAYRASKDIAPGVSVKEVHPGYIVLSENGALRRVELPAELKSNAGGAALPAMSSSMPPPRTMPTAPPAAATGSAASGQAGVAPAQQPTVVTGAPGQSGPTATSAQQPTPPAPPSGAAAGTGIAAPTPVQPGMPQAIPSQ